MEPRYAIYFVPPPDSDLYRFGASVLGIDIYTGQAVDFPSGAGAEWSDVVREPHGYGFHATLKAPFRLEAGASEDELVEAFDAFARDRSWVDGGPIMVAAVGSFIALIPSEACPAVGELAFACVKAFDCFRAPMTEEERERRLRAPLSPRQIGHLDTWGYPFVRDDFRFHMTLTGTLPLAERQRALQWLSGLFAERAGAARLIISGLVIARQTEGAFRIWHAAKLNGPS